MWHTYVYATYMKNMRKDELKICGIYVALATFIAYKGKFCIFSHIYGTQKSKYFEKRSRYKPASLHSLVRDSLHLTVMSLFTSYGTEKYELISSK